MPVPVYLVAVLLVAVLAAACSRADDAGAGGTDGSGSSTTRDDGSNAGGAGGSTTTTAPAPAEPEEVPVDADDFSEVPDPLPAGQHGDLIRYQPIAGPSDDVTQYRVMYLSESLAGDAIAVTGSVTVPDGDAPEGGWPQITLAHGTTGIADECTPSRGLGADGSNAAESSLLAGVAATRGYVVAATDYEGLGTPGRHPYLVGESEGRGVLDAALAARQLPGVEVGTEAVIAGYSQGGHAALFANEIAEEWAPDLEIKGTFAGAPASQLKVIASVAKGGGLAGGFFLMAVAGFEAAYEEADTSLILTPEGIAALDAVDEGCVGSVVAALAGPDYFKADPTTVEPWSTLLDENEPGATVTDAPILMIHSATDEVVPVGFSAAVLDRQCGGGQVVERRVLPEGAHTTAAPVAYQQAIDWFDARFDGDEPVSSCPGA